ncbi:MAG: hypothetical protein WBL25_21695 [Anaerolineales bacterium]
MAALLQVLEVYIKKPAVAAALGAIVGLIIGLTIGWGIWPVQWTDATPEVLRADLQADYMRMAIDSFRVNGNQPLAVQRWDDLGAAAPEAFTTVVQDPQGLDPVSIANYQQVITTARGSIEAGTPPPADEQGPSTSAIVISVAGILILAVVVFGAFYLIRNVFRVKPRGEASAAMQAADVNRQTEKTDFQSLGLAPPVTQTMTTYVMGDDLYDESFSIDTQGGDFLGEYGVGVSETIGVGDPKKVTALEVWLFDKNDIKTATKVLMSAHAFDDPELRSRLEAKGELVMLEPQGQIILETATLQLLVTVNDLEYGIGALPPDSYFERVTLELAIWPKEG